MLEIIPVDESSDGFYVPDLNVIHTLFTASLPKTLEDILQCLRMGGFGLKTSKFVPFLGYELSGSGKLRSRF